MSTTHHRYRLLDGLRGIAALFVVTRHTPADFWHFELFHSYLAVDLFFLLSGFVIASSYDEKLRDGRLPASEFMVIRLIRLYPMFLLSVLACGALDLHAIAAGSADFSRSQLARLVGRTALFIPSTMTGDHTLFSLNVPYWSLFFELIANALFAVARRRTSDGQLAWFAIACAAVLIVLTVVHGDLDFGFFAYFSSNLAGLVRATFGFAMGVLVFRKRGLMTASLPAAAPVAGLVGLVLFLAAPSLGRIADTAIDLAAVLFAFPLLIIVSSGDAPTAVDGIADVLGKCSYPIYVLHVPAGLIFQQVVVREGWAAPYAGLVFAVWLMAVCFFLERFVEQPVRRGLQGLLRNAKLGGVRA